MSVARHTEITASGPTIEQAISQGVERATKTLKNVKQIWIKEITAKVENDRVTDYRVDMKVSFVLDDA